MGHRLFLIAFGLVWSALLVISLDFAPAWFRPWERALASDGRHFRPDLDIRMQECGDLAWRLGIPSLRRWRGSRFTTDAHGFRNPPDIGAARVLVLGDSYTVGSGLRDEEMLTARLADELGEPVYSYAFQGGSVTGPHELPTSDRFGEHPPEIVAWMPAWRLVGPTKNPRGPARFSPRRALQRIRTRLDDGNGLSTRCRALYQHTAWRLLGHRDVAEVAGEPVILLDLKEQGLFTSADPRRLTETVNGVLAFRDALAARRIKLLYVPIPEMGSLYPELYPENERRRITPHPFVPEVVRKLKQADVQVVDLHPFLQENKVPFLFQGDDTHWNARCVELVAQRLARELR